LSLETVYNYWNQTLDLLNW